MRARFVDISRYQGQVDASHLSANSFIGMCARCTIGWSYKDPFYINNFKEAAADGLLFGAYHVLWPSNNNPRREAQWFFEQMKVNGDLPHFIVADLERMGGRKPSSVANQIVILLAEMKSLTGINPIVYTGSWFWNGALGPATPIGIEKDHPLWEAEYTTGRLTPNGSVNPSRSPEPPEKPSVLGAGWDEWWMWQWTSKGIPYGAPDASNMDYNVFNGTEEDFMKWLGLGNQLTLEEKVDALWEAHPELHPPEGTV